MRVWERVNVSAKCGQCGTFLEDNQIAQFMTLPNVKRRLVRCASCAGEAPPDLPARIVEHTTTKRFTPIAKLSREWSAYKEPE